MTKYKKPVQVFMFLFILGITILGFLADQGVVLPDWFPTCLHGVCPFGGVVTLGRLFTQGLYIPKTGLANLAALSASLFGTVLFGAFFCGWLCPLGSLQDWVGGLSRKFRQGISGLTKTKETREFSHPDSEGAGGRIFPLKVFFSTFVLSKSVSVSFMKPVIRINKRADHLLGYLRYIVLALIVYLTTRSINLVFAKIDPFYALFNFWTGLALPLSIVILGIVVFASLFIDRPWCRWLCPFGAVQGLVQKISPWKIRKNRELCNNCGLCSARCPMKIDFTKKDRVTDSRCNRCLVCVASCKKPGALQLRLADSVREKDKKVKTHPLVNPGLAALLAVLLFLIPLALGKGITLSAESVPRGEFRNLENPVAATGIPEQPKEISGTDTLKQAAGKAGLEVEELLSLLELSMDFETSVLLRDLEEYHPEKTFRWIRNRLDTLGEDS